MPDLVYNNLYQNIVLIWYE